MSRHVTSTHVSSDEEEGRKKVVYRLCIGVNGLFAFVRRGGWNKGKKKVGNGKKKGGRKEGRKEVKCQVTKCEGTQCEGRSHNSQCDEGFHISVYRYDVHSMVKIPSFSLHSL